jgi:hypothetical protein
MFDRDISAVIEKTLRHEGEAVGEFYAAILFAVQILMERVEVMVRR